MKLIPTENRIVVEPIEPEEQTKGSIIIPDTAKEKPLQGIVLAVGPGKQTENGTIIRATVGVGAKILFGKYAGVEIEDGDKTYLIMRSSDVQCVIGKEVK